MVAPGASLLVELADRLREQVEGCVVVEDAGDGYVIEASDEDAERLMRTWPGGLTVFWQLEITLRDGRVVSSTTSVKAA